MDRICKTHKTFAVLIVAFMFLITVQIPLFIGDDSSAVADAPVQNISVKMFDQDSGDFSDLIYLSDELPMQLNASEWALDETSGHWYNVNKSSSRCGTLLRYGDIVNMAVSEIHSDVINHYNTVFAGPDFIVLQVEYETIGDCSVTIDMKKNGVNVLNDNHVESTVVAGNYRDASIQRAYLYSVDIAGDIAVSTAIGDYSTSVKCNGVSMGDVSFRYGGTMCTLSGIVNDAGGKGIQYVTVAYEVTDSEATVISEGSVVTLSDGSFTINVQSGVIVNIKSLTASGFSFTEQTYSYGTVMGDATAPAFVANEHYIKVTMTDQSDLPAQGAQVSAAWYAKPDGIVTISVIGLQVPYDTDANGNAVVVVSQVVTGAKLLIKGVDNEYSFDVEPINAGGTYLPDTVVKEGNVYGNVSTYADVSLKAEDYSVVINTAGNMEGLSGGAILQGVHLMASWYYQKEDAGNFTIRDKDSIEDGTFTGLVGKGKTWFRNPYSTEEGKVILHYTHPVGSFAPGESAYLYVYADKASSSSPSASYTFTYVIPADGTSSIVEIADSYPTCIAMLNSAIIENTVRSDEVAYALRGTFAKTSISDQFPSSITVYCTSESSIGMIANVTESGGVMQFSFPVKSGTSCTIEVDDVIGYYLSNQLQTMPNAHSDMLFSCNVTQLSSSIDRGVPVSIGDYNVTGLVPGVQLTFKYKVAGADMTLTKMSTGNNMNVTITGWTGDTVESLAVSGEGIYVSEIMGTTIHAAVLKQFDFVTYYDETNDTPTIGNVVGGQAIRIFCDGALYTTIVTDQNGRASVTIPDSENLTYKYDNLSITSVPVTEGAYSGCCGINMKDVIASPGAKQVSFTIRYIATSSLQNEEKATNTDILESPVAMTMKVGETKVMTAPEVSGFEFSGWYLNGTSLSNSRNPYTCEITATEDMEGSTLTASYSAITPEPPKEGLGTIIAIGALAVVMSIIALIYVILQIRRY